MIAGILSRITTITSFWFFVFLFLAAALYYITPRAFRWVTLLALSTVFFVLACSRYLWLVFAGQTLIAWGSTFVFSREKNSPRLKKFTVTLAIVLEAGTLVLFKENSFFTINARIITRLFGGQGQFSLLNMAAPIGISYYTLMLISYILDVSWGKIQPQKNPLKLILYAGFFPQMVSGPFTRYEEVSARLYEGHTFNIEEIQFGLQKFLWGLFKKFVLAERLAVIAAFIYGGGAEGTWAPTGVYVFIGAFSYTLQLYTDFSGCMDIVIGAARLFGIKLPENFRTPFYSTSLSEVWRRWHMTLGLWLKDYVMYPVQKALTTQFGRAAKDLFGKKRGKNIILYASMLTTWFAIGFWHGGSWKYICSSGLFFFVMITGGLILDPLFLRLRKFLRINAEAWSWTLFCRLRTFFLFSLSVSFGRAASLTDGFTFWGNAFTYNPWVLVDGSLYKIGLDRLDFWVMVFALILLAAVSKLQQNGSVREKIAAQNLVFRWILWLSLFTAVLLFGMYGEGYNPADFIYGGF